MDNPINGNGIIFVMMVCKLANFSASIMTILSCYEMLLGSQLLKLMPFLPAADVRSDICAKGLSVNNT